jgi:acyl-CoA thioester hydrolase
MLFIWTTVRRFVAVRPGFTPPEEMSLTTIFTQIITLRWADLDPNGHVRHSVYYDFGAQVRIAFLEAQGVGVSWMAQNSVGPVLFREEARFLRELRLGDNLTIDFRIAGASADGRKWRARHEILRGGSERVATLEVDGAWLDLRSRKVAAPPPELIRAFEGLARTEDFQVLPSGSKQGQSTVS